MNILPGSAALRAPVPAKTDTPPGARPADPSVQAQAQTQAQRNASVTKEAPRQDKVASAYRIERPMPQPQPNAPRGSCVNLLV